MLEGSIVALVTPFNEKKEINYNKLSELIEFHYNNGTHALLVLGTTSESPTITEPEKEEIIKFVVKQNRGRMKLLVGVTSNCTLTSIKKAKRYEELGADYLLVISPYYNKTNDKGLIKHYLSIAQSVNIPIVIYNIPSRTGINISAKVMKELKKNERIIGVKEASRDISHIVDVAGICDDSFYLYCGNDDLIILFMLLNAKGIINVYGNVDPRLIVNLYNLRKNHSQLFKLFYQYIEVFKAIFCETNPIPIKALMNYIGMDIGGYRLPLSEMDELDYNYLIDTYNLTYNRKDK